MKDLGSTKLDATPEVASTNELPTKDADTAKARQEKAKHSSVAIAAAPGEDGDRLPRTFWVSSNAAALSSGRATRHPVQPPAFGLTR